MILDAIISHQICRHIATIRWYERFFRWS